MTSTPSCNLLVFLISFSLPQTSLHITMVERRNPQNHTMTYTHPTTPPPPPRTLLLQNLTTQTHLLTQLFTHLSQSSSSSSTSSTLSSSLIGAPSNQSNLINQLYTFLRSTTDDMASIVQQVRQHQTAYTDFERQKKSVISLERQVRSLIHSLESSRSELEAMISEARETAKSLDRATTGPSTLLSPFLFLPLSLFNSRPTQGPLPPPFFPLSCFHPLSRPSLNPLSPAQWLSNNQKIQS